MTDLQSKVTKIIGNGGDSLRISWDVLNLPEIATAQARIADLEAALQEIASYGNMNDKVGWAVQAARKALKLANDKGE